MTRALNPLLEGARPRSLLGLGTLGTGKTVVAKYVMQDFVKKADQVGLRVVSAYVSCIRYRGMYDVLLKATHDVLGRDIGRGYVRGHYVDVLEKEIGRANGFLLLLDEVDSLAIRKTADFSDLLYTISRHLPRTCAIMLTSKRKVADVLQHDIDARSRDTFRWDPVDFPSYDAIQLQDILRPRVELAYQPGICTDGIINKICAVCCDQGLGARGAVEIARRIGEMAEQRRESFLSEDDIDVATTEMMRRLVRGPIASLDRQCKAILLGILTKQTMATQELERYYANYIAPNLKAGESREAFYYHLGHLREVDLLVSWRQERLQGRGSEGRIEIDPSQLDIVKDALAGGRDGGA